MLDNPPLSYVRSSLQLNPFISLCLIFLLFFSGCTYKENFLPVTRDKKTAEYRHLGLIVLENNVSIQNNIDIGALRSIEQSFTECIAISPPDLFLSAATLMLCLPVNLPLNLFTSEDTQQKLEILKTEKGSIQASLKDTGLQKRLRTIAINYARKNMVDIIPLSKKDIRMKNNGAVDYSPLSSKGIDTVIEFEIMKITLDESGLTDAPVFITLEIKSRLIKTVDNHIEGISDKTTASNVHTYQEWLSNDFKLLKDECDTLLKEIAFNHIDEHLFLYYPKLPKSITESTSKREAPYYVLNAYYPKPIFATPDMREMSFKEYERVNGSSRRFVPIKEQKPLLKWEPFPWSYDQVAQERFSDIVYDLEVYEYEGPLVYAKKGLQKNEHKLEEALSLGGKYLWTVRARFKLDGDLRFTEWGGFYGGRISDWRDQHAWKFGTKRAKGHIDFAPLNKKKYHYYPFMVLER